MARLKKKTLLAKTYAQWVVNGLVMAVLSLVTSTLPSFLDKPYSTSAPIIPIAQADGSTVDSGDGRDGGCGCDGTDSSDACGCGSPGCN